MLPASMVMSRLTSPRHDPVRLDRLLAEGEGVRAEYPLYPGDVFLAGEGEVVVVRQAAEGKLPQCPADQKNRTGEPAVPDPPDNVESCDPF